jgi:hypothetical protein
VHAPPPHGSLLRGGAGAHHSEEEGPCAHRSEEEPPLGRAIIHMLSPPLLLIAREEPVAAPVQCEEPTTALIAG